MYTEMTSNDEARSPSSRRSKIDEMLADEDQEIDCDQVVEDKKRRKRAESAAALKEADKAAHRAKMGDFFMV